MFYERIFYGISAIYFNYKILANVYYFIFIYIIFFEQVCICFLLLFSLFTSNLFIFAPILYTVCLQFNLVTPMVSSEYINYNIESLSTSQYFFEAGMHETVVSTAFHQGLTHPWWMWTWFSHCKPLLRFFVFAASPRLEDGRIGYHIFD